MVALFLTAAIVFGIVILVIVNRFGKKFARPLNRQYFDEQWTLILGRVKTPEGMILAVIDADKLLDEALKKRGFRGKTMGERLVAAQHSLSNNDGVWYGHKLRNRLVHETNVKIRKAEARSALEGIRQGLKDLGAL